MRILLTPIGTHGDLHPFLGLGMELQRRGHDVQLITSPYFQKTIDRSGLPFIPFGTVEEYRQILDNPQVWHPSEGFKILLRFMVVAMRPLYDLIASHHVPGQTILVHSPMGLAARLAHEKLGIPSATVHLAPSSLRSVELPLNLANLWLPRWSPTFVKRFVFWAADRFVVGPIVDEPLNAFRAELELSAISRPLKDWWNSPQRILALFPDWFGTMGPDWPDHVRLCSFPLFDERGMHDLPADLEAFLQAGDAPIIFTPGSGMQFAHFFFRAAVEACAALGKRGILLTLHRDQIPAELPATIRYFTYIPFSQVFPRSAAVVHHGGVGTTAQGLAAGVPQLIMPMAYDQPDNADRLHQLGVGAALPVKHFTGVNLAAELRTLLTPEVRVRAQALAARLANQQPLAKVCDEIESLASPPASGIS